MGKIITDAALQKALREIKLGQKNGVYLTDPGVRGAGRLMAKIRPGLVEWYAQRIVGGQRKLSKLGTWPAMSCAQAREAFGAPPAPVLEPAAKPPEKQAKKPAGPPMATFGDLCSGYVAHLRANGAKSVVMAKTMLEQASDVIGRKRPANAVTPSDIVAVLKPIYDRGAPVMADKMRVWLNAAFRWGMQAEHSYKVATPRKWGLTSNPVAAVPRDQSADRVGQRWLTAKELNDLLHWAMGSPAKSRKAIALIALTGQRVHEITYLRPENWDSKARMLSWKTTKNGLPHTIPVCKQAAAVLDSLRPGPGGWLFPNNSGASRPMPDGSVLGALNKYSARWKMKPFTGRDLRRTWKTLAGEAGLTKVERDLLQNHTEGSDVSSRHYDRYLYMAEKRAAVAKWEAWLLQQTGKRQPKADASQIVDRQ